MPLTGQAVLDYIANHPGKGQEDIRKNVAPKTSDTTMWRTLKRLTDDGKLAVTGKARATKYAIAGSAVIRAYLQTPYNRRLAKVTLFASSYNQKISRKIKVH